MIKWNNQIDKKIKYKLSKINKKNEKAKKKENRIKANFVLKRKKKIKN